MGLLKSYRRKILYQIFKKKNAFPTNFKNERLKVLFFANGGIGDLLSSICFIERFYTYLGDPQIDFLVHTNRKQIVLDFFGEKVPPFLNAIYSRKEIEWKSFSKYIKKEYDIFVELCGYVPLYYLNHPKKIEKRCPTFLNLHKKYLSETKHLMPGHINRPYYDGYFAQIAAYKNLNRKSFLGYLGQIPISNEAYIPLSPHPQNLEILKQLGIENETYITLHSGSDIVYEVQDNLTTKQWPVKNYEALIQMIKAYYPSIKIIYLKGPNSSDIKGADITLETSFKYLLWILKYSRCHIDCESGLVRIARELHSKSVVLFGPTNYDFFKFEENENLKPNVCGNCFWLDKKWQTGCMKGYKIPPCMSSITVESVFEAFEKIYRQTDNQNYFKLSEPVALPENSFNPPLEKLRVAILIQDENDFDISMPNAYEVDYFFMSNSLNLYDKLKSSNKIFSKFGSIFNLPCESISYDLLVCSINIDEPYIEYVFKEFLRVLKTDGSLQISCKTSKTKDVKKLATSFLEHLSKNQIISVNEVIHKTTHLFFEVPLKFKKVSKVNERVFTS